MSAETRKPGNRVDVDATYAVLKQCYDEGPTDMSAGVPTGDLKDALNITSGTGVNDRMRHLIDAGRAELVWGFAYDTNRPRRSYVPIDDSEGDDE